MKLPLVATPAWLGSLLARWLSAWIARSEARWQTLGLRQHYY